MDAPEYFCLVKINVTVMRWKISLLFVAAAIALACDPDRIQADFSEGNDDMAGHEMIVLGRRLENPYTTENVRDAYESLYPTKSRYEIQTTHLYVRFLPKNEAEFKILKELELVDYPVDYEILKDGDYYHDPSLSDEQITWQYSVVDKDFTFPEGIDYEIIDECVLSENSPVVRSSPGVDWEALEREAYRLTGNSDKLVQLTKGSSNESPEGRITIVDDKFNAGTPFGLSGVKVVANTFVKFVSAYTDRDGNYQMDKSFTAKPRYRIMFQNEEGFSIGFNLVLVPASVSALGKGETTGMDVQIDSLSDAKLFMRSIVNNAAYEYYKRCSRDDLNLPQPPEDLRIWLFGGLESSSAVMLHHGAILDQGIWKKYLAAFSSLIKYFAPDITIGTKNLSSYSDIYDNTVHELAHASHFKQVGTGYWGNYLKYVIESFVSAGGTHYGNGGTQKSGYCEIGEMWAYYIESKLHYDRYGGEYPSFGCSYWFYPQIFKQLEDRGLSSSNLLSALQVEVSSRTLLRDKLTTLFPAKSTVIEQVFTRYQYN